MKTAVFRADSSAEIGTGHLMRCLTLANALRDLGVSSHFLWCDLPGHQNALIKAQEFSDYQLETGSPDETRAIASRLSANWMIVDHYALEAEWERSACPSDCAMVVIDDLADRSHACALILDQNLSRVAGNYDNLVPDTAVQLLGVRFALLRPEFSLARSRSLATREVRKTSNVFVNFGGADPNNITSKVLTEIAQNPRSDRSYTVVLGGAANNKPTVRELATRIGAQVVENATNMAQLMTEADIAVGAAGSTTWERCCLGLPTGMIILAENQRMLALAMERAGAGNVLADLTGSGDLSEVSRFLDQSLADRMALSEMSARAAGLVDGHGATRVAEAIVSLEFTNE